MSSILTVYNLSVNFVTKDFNIQKHLDMFLDKFYTVRQKGGGNNQEETVQTFYGKVKDKADYQLHSVQFIHFYQYLKELGTTLGHVDKIDNRSYDIASADFKIREGWKFRDDQVPVRDFIMEDPKGSILIPLTMGSGKTSIALMTIAEMQQRLAIVILPAYIDKWVSDITKVHEASERDVMVVQGSKSLMGLIQLAREDKLEHKYLIFSNRTLQDYITQYEEDPEFCYERFGCTPIELMSLLGVGEVLIDETHQHFNSIFKIIIYSNVKLQLGLSATLMSDDPTISRVHRVVYPKSKTYGDSMIKKYTDVYAIGYTVSEPNYRHIKTSAYGSNTYSHVMYEQSVVRKPFMVSNYNRLITDLIEEFYVASYQEKDKLLIFVSTVDYATKLSVTLQTLYPERTVKRYCEQDPYEHILEADICVSTLMSAGTALDIPNLRVVIQTVSVSSPASNLQSFGRLRKLSDRDVKFCYIYALNVRKQKEYHNRRVELLRERAATITLRQARRTL